MQLVGARDSLSPNGVTHDTAPHAANRAALQREGTAMIKKMRGGYQVLSETTGRNLGGPYKTLEEAKKRLRQVEFFKRRKG